MQRLVAAVVLVGILAGVASVTVVRRSAESALRDEVEADLGAIGHNLAAALDARIDGLARMLSLVATRADIAALSTDTTELAVALRASGEFDELVLYDRSGDPLAAVSARSLVSAESLPTRADLADVVTDGGPSVTVTGDDFPEAEIVVPVDDPPGHVVGMLAGKVPVEILASGLGARFLGPSAAAFVVGEDGTLLSHPRRDLVLAGRRYPLDRFRDDGVETLERRRGDVIAAVVEASTFPGSVVLERDRDEAFEAVGDEVTDLTVLLVAVLGVAVVAVAALGTRLVRPLSGLATTVRRLAAGDHSARAEITGSAELRVVAEEVNRMADALERRMEELVEAQRELRVAEERFRTAFEEAPVSMALASIEGRYERVNPALCELLGRTEAELVGTNWRDLTHPDDLEASELAVDDAFRTGARSYQVEKRYLRPDGTPVPVLLSVAFAGGVDRPRYFIAHLLDMTERHRADDQARTLRDVRVRQRQAVEVNDNIVQGLTLAKWWFELERLDAARDAVERTLDSARELINDMLWEGVSGNLRPGDLVRERPADFRS